MEITEVRIYLKQRGDRKLKAYASVTYDDSFVVRNIKIIEGRKGIFVAMPSRKLKKPCPNCGYSNPLRSKFCNQCGKSLEDTQAYKDSLEMNRQAQHQDVAHPINAEFREYLQEKVLKAYEEEKAKSPESNAEEDTQDYGSDDDDFDEDLEDF